MIVIRDSHSRGRVVLDWLKSLHSFSFGNYYDPNHMGFKSLRVINEDVIKPGKGFSSHSHKNMEIITYIIKGSVEHKDSLGNLTVIKEGEIQCMSAGTGVTHSEYNGSQEDILHLLQIWILPNQTGLTPIYQQRSANFINNTNNLNLLISSTAEQGSLLIHQDVKLYLGKLEPTEQISFELQSGRDAWLQIITGDLLLNGITLKAGDGAAISQENHLVIEAGKEKAEFLLFDLN